MKKRIGRNIFVYLLIFAIVLVIAAVFSAGGSEPKEVKYSKFITMLDNHEFTSVTIDDEDYIIEGKTEDGASYVTYVGNVLTMDRINSEYLSQQIKENDLTVKYEPPGKSSAILSMIPTIIMIGVLIFFFFMIMNQSGGGGKAMSFGKSRAKLQRKGDGKKVTFRDVAGLDEEKEELEEIVDFLKRPRKYRALGARIPKGILLVGPPGTGKTYISKATAGEANVPFFTISGSDFVEMFVGVGASRVRDLFDQAKKNAPCIIFIDEIDAVGRKRGAGLGGGHDEREQTLNQLLVEMDGFAENIGIIVLAATNRPDILDPALLRPGRFDRQIVIGTPDVKGREEIFKVHSRNKPLDESVNPKVLARRTPGFTPADIENMLNEAALLTARRNGLKIRMDEIEEAITKVIAGPEKKSRVISDDERKLTAYHEAGHAVVARSLPKSDPVHQITIIPRGRAGGFTMILPKEDKYYETKETMEEQIVHLLGGRVAEMLTLDDISTGASNDIMRATEIAKEMVTKYGFSEKLGPVNYSSSDEVLLGKDFTSKQNYSEETANEIDEEVKAIIEKCYKRATDILTENMDKLKIVAEALLELETLDGEQFEKLCSGELTTEELVDEVERRDNDIKEANEREAKEAEKIQKRQDEAEARSRELARKAAEMHENGDLPPFFRPKAGDGAFDEKEMKRRAKERDPEDDVPYYGDDIPEKKPAAKKAEEPAEEKPVDDTDKTDSPDDKPEE